MHEISSAPEGGNLDLPGRNYTRNSAHYYLVAAGNVPPNPWFQPRKSRQEHRTSCVGAGPNSLKLLLTTHYSLLTTHYLLLTTHYSHTTGGGAAEPRA